MRDVGSVPPHPEEDQAPLGSVPHPQEDQALPHGLHKVEDEFL